MSRRGAVAAALTIALGGLWSTASLAAAPVRLTVAFDRGASLGAATAVRAGLRVDARRLSSPLTALRLLYPRGMGIASSGLGLAACRRPPSDFVQVILDDVFRCPRNAVLGYGSARGDVRLSDGEVIPEYAAITVLAGPLGGGGGLGLVAYVEGQHPFGARLVYHGELAAAPAPFGGVLAVHMPEIPTLVGFAVVSLLDVQLSIGSHAITYYDHVGRRTIAYHPDGLDLPRRCPKRGFRFRAELSFQDGAHAVAETVVRCPRPAPAAR